MSSDQSPQDIARWLLAKLGKHKKSGGSYQFRCPAHDDKAASGSLKVYQDGVGLKCFAGCTTDVICGALGIQKSELFVPVAGARSSRILRSYRYFDESGGLACVHHRMVQRTPSDAKFLWQRSDEEGNAIWSLGHGWFERRGQNWRRLKKDAKGKDVDHDDSQTSPKAGARWFDDAPPRALYHQSRLKDVEPGALLIWNEGEKDAETAEGWGFLSTTAGGAQDWQERYADVLAGFDLVIIADNDNAGRIHAAKVAADCYDKAARVRVIEGLPDVEKKGDLSDWAAMGKTRADLLAVIEATPDYAPAGEVVEDESTAVLIEPDDAPLSDDPKIDERVRRIAFNAAKVNVSIGLIMRKLGFKADHTRLLTNLASVKPGHLGTIVCVLKWLADVYGMSVDTVSRDIQKLLDEQERLGVEVLTYHPGTKNPATGEGYGSKFRRVYLRLALRAIAVAIETRRDPEYSHEALNRACDEVVRDIKHKLTDSSAKVDSEGRAEKRADAPTGEALKFKHQIKAAVAMKRLLLAMAQDGLTTDDAELILSEAFNDATDWARARAEAAGETKDADHIETVEASESLSLNTNTDSLHENSAGSASAYSPQNADHIAHARVASDAPESLPFPMAAEDYYQQDINAGRAGPQANASPDASPALDFEGTGLSGAPPGDDAACETCGCPLDPGVAYCPGCGNLYPRAGQARELATGGAMEAF